MQNPFFYCYSPAETNKGVSMSLAKFPIEHAWKGVLGFWFDDSTEQDWFSKNLDYDKKIVDNFSVIHEKARSCELESWRAHPMGALAEIIVLDQFSRNMFRGTPESFAYDGLALCLAQRCIELGYDERLNARERRFLYMPYMHSESKLIHQHAMTLFERLGDQNTLKFEVAHKKIIDQFGRYPHRNEILRRSSSSEEIEFLKQEGSSF